MAKRPDPKNYQDKWAEEPAEAAVAAETPEPAAPVAEAAPVAASVVSGVDPLAGLEEHFTRGTYAGMEQWKCAHCAWDTLNGAPAMRRHLDANHLAAGEPRQIAVADKRGKEIS